ncbi:MAG: hypothetical protein MJ246_06945 [Clostridia bacterium]|nr:hypothetical protein [Clostridia bacterium]
MNGQNFTPNDEETTLYACFEPRTYTIEFDGNTATSGSMSSMIDINYIEEVTLSKNTFAKHNEVTFDSMGGEEVSNIGYDSNFIG